MYQSIYELYEKLLPYVCEIVQNNEIALKLVDVFIKVNLPLQNFITSAKLFIKIYDLKKYVTSNYNLMKNIIEPKMNNLKSLIFLNYSNSTIINYYDNKYIIMISCCIISSKYYMDTPFTNHSWQEITGVSLDKLNEFEKITVEILNYEINTIGDDEIYLRTQKELKEATVVCKKEKKEKKEKSYLRKLFCMA